MNHGIPFTHRIATYAELFVEMDKRMTELALERNQLHSRLEALSTTVVSSDQYNEVVEERDSLKQLIDELKAKCTTLDQQRNELQSNLEESQRQVASLKQELSSSAGYYEYTLCVNNPSEYGITAKTSHGALVIVDKHHSGGVTTITFRSDRPIGEKSDLSLRVGREEFFGWSSKFYELNPVGYFVPKYKYSWQIQYRYHLGSLKVTTESADIPVVAQVTHRPECEIFVYDLAFESDSKLKQEDLVLWHKSLNSNGTWKRVLLDNGHCAVDLLREVSREVVRQ